MKKRPSAIWHMIKWGAGSGIILAMAYLVVISDMLYSGFNPMIWRLPITPFAWLIAFFAGGLPGAVMGLLVGIVLWWLMREVSLPFSKADMMKMRRPVYSRIATMTFALSAFIILLFIRNFDFVIAFPPFIAAIASVYAAHRYMFRLRLWSGGIETDKVKAKNDVMSSSRLIEDSPQEINIAEEIPSISTQSERNS